MDYPFAPVVGDKAADAREADTANRIAATLEALGDKDAATEVRRLLTHVQVLQGMVRAA